MEIQLPHFDAIVISTNIRGAKVRRILVDESFYDIFFLEVFTRMAPI